MKLDTRLTAGLLLLLASAPAAQAGVKIQTYDALASPGGSTQLGAKFERGLMGWVWSPDLEKKQVEVGFGGQTFSGRTDDEGMIRFPITAPSQPGVYSFTAKYKKTSAVGKLYVTNKPLAIVDIDGTISDLPDWQVPFRGAKAKTFPGSPELLRDLSRTHQVVYLTARDDVWNSQTRAFLARHNFPDGPVIYNELGQGNHGEFKLAKIRELRAMGLNPALGIGNAETDAYAYETAGIPSYIRTNKVVAGSTSYRFLATDDLRRRLVQDGVLLVGLAGVIGSTP
ncbi:MAG: hypothetical protein AB7N76_34935 [Planctomycetota bacterium]